jgi:hypothetical protein
VLTTSVVTAAPVGLKTTISTTACASASGGGVGSWVLQSMSAKKFALIVAASLGLIIEEIGDPNYRAAEG